MLQTQSKGEGNNFESISPLKFSHGNQRITESTIGAIAECCLTSCNAGSGVHSDLTNLKNPFNSRVVNVDITSCHLTAEGHCYVIGHGDDCTSEGHKDKQHKNKNY